LPPERNNVTDRARGGLGRFLDPLGVLDEILEYVEDGPGGCDQFQGGGL